MKPIPIFRARNGFTLVESLMAVSLLAIATVSIVAPILASYQQQRESKELNVAGTLCRQLMDEIAAKPFTDPNGGAITLGPDAGESGRAAYDNIDDYDGYADGTGGINAIDGSVVTSSGGTYRRSVTAKYRTTPNGINAASGDFLFVTVTVQTPSGQQLTTERLFAKYTKK